MAVVSVVVIYIKNRQGKTFFAQDERNGLRTQGKKLLRSQKKLSTVQGKLLAQEFFLHRTWFLRNRMYLRVENQIFMQKKGNGCAALLSTFHCLCAKIAL